MENEKDSKTKDTGKVDSDINKKLDTLLKAVGNIDTTLKDLSVRFEKTAEQVKTNTDDIKAIKSKQNVDLIKLDGFQTDLTAQSLY